MRKCQNVRGISCGELCKSSCFPATSQNLEQDHSVQGLLAIKEVAQDLLQEGQGHPLDFALALHAFRSHLEENASLMSLGGLQKGGSQKSGFGRCSWTPKTGTMVPKPERWYQNRNEGTKSGTTVPKTRTRVHSPKPSFYKTALLFPLDLSVCSSVYVFLFSVCVAVCVSLCVCVCVCVRVPMRVPSLPADPPSLCNLRAEPTYPLLHEFLSALASGPPSECGTYAWDKIPLKKYLTREKGEKTQASVQTARFRSDRNPCLPTWLTSPSPLARRGWEKQHRDLEPQIANSKIVWYLARRGCDRKTTVPCPSVAQRPMRCFWNNIFGQNTLQKRLWGM